MRIREKKWYMMLLAAACFIPAEVQAAPAAEAWVYDDL